jgi:hypothetical protein
MGKSQCVPCGAGKLCADGQITQDCPQGYYCPPGTFAVENFTCPKGKYGASVALKSIDECTICDSGKFCNGAVPNIAPTGDCLASFFCGQGSETPDPTAGVNGNTSGVCTVGNYCPSGSKFPLSCPPGKYGDETGLSVCKNCSAGSYCEKGTGETTPCPKGSYCPAGSTSGTEFQCPRGKFNNATNSDSADDCLNCLKGHYCGTEGLSEPTGPCTGGYFCNSGSKSRSPVSLQEGGGVCNPGYFCPEGSSSQTPCTRGKYCPSPGMTSPFDDCDAGFVCAEGAMSKNSGASVERCPTGFYCPKGTVSALPCPRGKYNGQTQMKSLSDCEICPKGMYCAAANLSTPNGVCDAGYACDGGQNTSRPIDGLCQIGHLCEAGTTAMMPCPAGKFQKKMGQSECNVCPSGFYCSNASGPVSMYESYTCPPGHFCPNGTRFATEFPCPPGTYSPNSSLSDLGQCEVCPPGMYCNSNGKTSPSGQCSSGYYCKSGARSKFPGGISDVCNARQGIACPTMNAGICPVGHYCERGAINPLPCHPGTYSNVTGNYLLSQCKACEPGMYCGSSGLGAPEGKCHAGFYCSKHAIHPNPGKGSGYGDVCPPGHYCSEGTSDPTPCPSGKISDVFGAVSVRDCASCPPGHFCQFPGQIASEGTCTAGYYCSLNATVANPIDNVTGNICPVGTYCEEASSAPLLCPEGKFSSSPGQSVCETCAAGISCASGTAPVACPRGSYCPEGTGSIAVACPRGTFRNHTGGRVWSDCAPCLGGYYCGESGLVEPSAPCAPGHYCLIGSNQASPLGLDQSNASNNSGAMDYFYSIDNSTCRTPAIADACPKGFHGPGGSALPLPC